MEEEGKVVCKKDHAVLAQELREYVVDSFVNGDGAKDAYIQSLVTQYVHHDIWSERVKETFTLLGDACQSIFDKSVGLILQIHSHEANNAARAQAALRNFHDILSRQASELVLPKNNAAESSRFECPQPPASSVAKPEPDPAAAIPEPVAATPEPVAGISNVTALSSSVLVEQWLSQNPGTNVKGNAV